MAVQSIVTWPIKQIACCTFSRQNGCLVLVENFLIYFFIKKKKKNEKTLSTVQVYWAHFASNYIFID